MADDLMKRLKPLFDNGFGWMNMSPAKAEAMVKDLVKQGELRRKEAERLVQRFVDQGRESTERLVELVRTEVTKQLNRLAGQVQAIEGQVEDLAAKVRETGTKVASRAPGGASTPTPVPAKKVAAKAATARKAAAAKKAAPVKKSAAAKTAAPAKKTASRPQ